MKLASKPAAAFGLALFCATLMAGCANQPKRETGTQVGMVLGAVVGVLLGNNTSSRAAGAALGAAVGGLVGRGIGEHLDEVDRLKAEVATLTALREPSTATVTWTSDRNAGVGGVVTSSPPTQTSQGTCKRVSHIVNVNGKEQREENQWCQKPNGSWGLV
jgi:surface antigen